MAQNINLYRELSCENYQQIRQDLICWIENLDLEFKEFWNPIDIKDLILSVPSFRSWLQESDLLISSGAITYGTTIDCCSPHIDTPPARFKLTFPVKNTKGSWNRWFQPKTSQIQSRINHLGGKLFYDTDALDEIGRREVLGPALIDAGIIHDVWFDSQHPPWPRLGLQCKLFKEPSAL